MDPICSCIVVIYRDTLGHVQQGRRLWERANYPAQGNTVLVSSFCRRGGTPTRSGNKVCKGCLSSKVRAVDESGWSGRGSSHGRSWCTWKQFELASSYEPHMTFLHLPGTSVNSTVKIRHAPSAQPHPTRSTSLVAARQALHKAVKPGGTTRCWNAWQPPWTPDGHQWLCLPLP